MHRPQLAARWEVLSAGVGVRCQQPAVHREAPRTETAVPVPRFATAETGDEEDTARMALSVETPPTTRVTSSAETAHTTRVASSAETARTARACRHQRWARATLADWGASIWRHCPRQDQRRPRSVWVPRFVATKTADEGDEDGTHVGELSELSSVSLNMLLA